MKFIFSILLFLLAPISYGSSVYHFEDLGKIPVLHDGRIKPLDTLARVSLLTLYGKEKLPNQSGMAWLTELLFDNLNAYERKVFNITNPDVVAMMDLKWDTDHKYSFRQVTTSLRKVLDTVTKLHKMPPKQRTQSQNQLVTVYLKTLGYFELSRSLSLFAPVFVIESEGVAKTLKLEKNRPYNYMEMQRAQNILGNQITYLEDLKKKSEKRKLSVEEKEYYRLGDDLYRMQQDIRTQLLKVIPPQWEDNSDFWFSPWGVLQAGRGSPQTAELMNLWKQLYLDYQSQDVVAWNQGALTLKSLSQAQASALTSPTLLNLETQYSQWSLFTKALAFYILSFLLICLSWLIWPRQFYLLSVSMAGLGLSLHFLGVVLRIVIMERPPVTTLYESIIFVSLVAGVFGLILEWVRRNGMGLLITTLTGIVLLFVSQGYADDGDSMGMLVAVLNTNFWLATHVVTISIGYGCCFVAGIIGHIYLILEAFRPQKSNLSEIYRNMIGASLFALFFTLFGTILGGIWADQSWGRFWGWDPKENGALLIVLWLLFMIHGRLDGKFKGTGYAFGMVLTNIIVALAWFGVNLLNVGLHSYGFTDSIALNLALFSGFELLFGLGFYGWISWRKKKRAVEAQKST